MSGGAGAGAGVGTAVEAGAGGGEARMKLAALRRVDPYALEVVDCASHVALYTFDADEWEKTSVEGALFVYRRSGEPQHSLLVMNRLSTDNLLEPVARGLELQLQEPFLLYRNSRSRIYGVWFYDKDECVRLARRLQRLVEQAGPARAPVAAAPSAAASDQPALPHQAHAARPDIFTMLSKAQDDYNSNKGRSEPVPPRAPDLTSQSVMDFFAKAGGGAAQVPSAPPVAPARLFGATRPPAQDASAPFLQRLMSNPAHTVEHIEKQQRSVTPQEPLCNNNSNNASHDRQNGGFATDRPRESSGTDSQRIAMIAKSKKLHLHGVGEPVESNGQIHLENDLNFLRISSPKASSPLSTFLSQVQEAGQAASAFDESVRSMPMCSTINNCSETPQKPALMPPTMFTSTAVPESVLTPIRAHAGSEIRPEPLTRNQLLQAFNYLIKHDTEFVNKLHEAYVKSFSELVS